MSETPAEGRQNLSAQVMAPGAPMPGEFKSTRERAAAGSSWYSWRRWRSPAIHVAMILVLLGIWQTIFMLKI